MDQTGVLPSGRRCRHTIQRLAHAGERKVFVRKATRTDARAIAGLMRQLGYDASPRLIEQKLKAFEDSDHDAVFLAMGGEGDKTVAGCLSAHMLELFHTDGKLGRITSLIVDANMRRAGVGRALIERSTKYFRDGGCIRIEVNSGDHRPGAHAFYQAVGFTQDERRFIMRI